MAAGSALRSMIISLVILEGSVRVRFSKSASSGEASFAMYQESAFLAFASAFFSASAAACISGVRGVAAVPVSAAAVAAASAASAARAPSWR